MNVNIMLYIYLVICIGMILFNIANAILSHYRDRMLIHTESGFAEQIFTELRKFKENREIYTEHRRFLIKKLRKIGNMRAFDIALEKGYSEDPELVQAYLHNVSDVLVELMLSYYKNDPVELAYFPYLIKKYRILAGHPNNEIIEILFQLLREQSIYCRENAMQALYTIGDPNCVIEALKIIDIENKFYHGKLLTDGLLNFSGNMMELCDELWNNFWKFSTSMQITILNYFRFSSGNFCERMLDLMNDSSQDDELRFSCIRYFGKYRYIPAYESLLKYADSRSSLRWEYSAIASAALAQYPDDRTTKLLKSNLYNHNWYIRFNSSQSLERLGLTYIDLIDVLEGKDRYASEIIQYRFDVREIMDEEREAALC